MAYGFNEDRSKAPVYTKAEIDAMDFANDQALQQEVEARQSAVSQEAGARQVGDNTLNARIDNIIAQGQSTSGNTELIDIRTGYNGTVHQTAGTAVREQVKAISGKTSMLALDEFFDPAKATFSGMKLSENGIENTLTDSKTFARVICRGFYNDTDYQTFWTCPDMTEPGELSAFFVLKATYQKIVIKHNGSSQDLEMSFPVSVEEDTLARISFVLSGSNPSAVGGLVFKNISIIKATNPTVLGRRIQDRHLIIPNNRTPQISFSSSNAIIRFSSITDQAWFTDTLETEKHVMVSDILTSLGDKASLEDGVLTITIGPQHALVYDYEAVKLRVISSSDYMLNENYLVLLLNWWENIYGDWMAKIAYNDSLDKVYVNRELLIYPYFGAGGTIDYVDDGPSGNAVYTFSNTLSLLIPGLNSSIDITKADMVTQLGSYCVLDAQGNAVVTIPAYYALCLDMRTNTVAMVPRGLWKYYHMPLIQNAWGNSTGRLASFYYRNKLKELEARIDADVYLPDYCVDEVHDTLNKLSLLPPDNFNYIVLTDIHYSHPDFTETNLDHLMRCVKAIADGGNIDIVVCLGDLIEGGKNASKQISKNQIADVMTRLGSVNKPVAVAMGNHDNNAFNWHSWDAADKTTAKYITTNEFLNMAELPFGHNDDFYCIDFDDKHIRLVIANTCDYDEVVDSGGNVSISDDYDAIMIRQSQLDAIEQFVIDSDHDVVVGTHGIDMDLINLVDYINTHPSEYGNHKVVLYHTGHYHNDTLEYVPENHVNLIATDCTSMAADQRAANNCGPGPIGTHWLNERNPTTKNPARSKGNITDYLFDVVSVGHGYVNRIRFGAGQDGTLEIQ